MKSAVEFVDIPAVVFFDPGCGVEFALVDDEDAVSSVVGEVTSFPAYPRRLLRVVAW